eukprot:sb/3475108/
MTVCLTALFPTPSQELCYIIPCLIVDRENPLQPDSEIEYTRGKKDSLLDLDTWLKYANPGEWVGGVGGASEGVVIAVVVVLVILALILLGCAVKVLRCICPRCSSSKTRITMSSTVDFSGEFIEIERTQI